ncbi:solute carrier family 22 member 3-like isoform X2 [Galleria mellonella]|nr:solute carrier family 22 member 3-like isoform X2 [Galleria mellonella]XP_052753503.1 solute carrier family 22 member 3-like isoform X2 [Galleria mellonella]XP_052753504.1 solute carrier family 22 member 3-like isoform X2 [Galleria mellonella]
MTNSEVDYIVKSIGAFGIWQAIICTICMSARAILMWNITSILFLTSTTEFRCLKFEDDEPNVIENSTCYDNCLQYEYCNDAFRLNLIAEFDLICEKAWLASFVQTVLMFGVLIGVALTGWISDRFGRQIAIILSGVISVVFTIASSFALDFWSFTSLRFIVGLGCGGLMATTIVVIMEAVGAEHKEFAGGVSVLGDGVSQSILALCAYYSPTWNIYILSYGILSLFILIPIMFIPETPRWLVANRKIDKAINLMTSIANLNKLNTDTLEDNVIKCIKNIEEKQKEPPKTNFLDLFRTKEIAFTTVHSVIIWTIAGVSYFGINQYVTVLSPNNIYLVVIISGLIQIPATLTGMVFNKWFGRKKSSIVSFISIGVSMSILIFLPDDHWASTVFALVGLIAACILFTVIYVQANELFPTPLRNMGFGASSAGAKIGAMLAPFIVNFHPHWIASMIFAILPFVAAGFCLGLIETKGVKLKDTID